MKVIATILLLSCFLNSNAQAVWTSRQNKPKKNKVTMDEFRSELFGRDVNQALAIENGDFGKLVALFIIDYSRRVKYIKIINSPSDPLSFSTITALKNAVYPESIKSKALYALSINFKLYYITSDSYTFDPILSADSIQAKLPPPKSLSSGLIYNPHNIATPTKKPIILKELTKVFYKREPRIHSMQ